MWLFLSVLLLCSHFFPLLFFFFLPSILLPLFPTTLSRSSRWFLVEASPTSRVGGAERRTAVALTAPRRELSTRFSTCQSQSALCRVRASTTVFYLFISFGTHFYFCTSNLKMSKSWNHVFSVNNAPSSSCMLFVHSLWKWLEVLPDKPRQEDAHRLHQERDALRHGEVSGTSLSQGRALSHQISERRREAALPFTGGADERNGDSLVQRRRSFKLRWASSLLLSV